MGRPKRIEYPSWLRDCIPYSYREIEHPNDKLGLSEAAWLLMIESGMEKKSGTCHIDRQSPFRLRVIFEDLKGLWHHLIASIDPVAFGTFSSEALKQDIQDVLYDKLWALVHKKMQDYEASLSIHKVQQMRRNQDFEKRREELVEQANVHLKSLGLAPIVTIEDTRSPITPEERQKFIDEEKEIEEWLMDKEERIFKDVTLRRVEKAKKEVSLVTLEKRRKSKSDW